jgi:hypothetical protein
LGVSACVRAQELPLATNMVRLDVNPSGAHFALSVREAALRRAAELTLQNGYSAFRLTPTYMLAFNHFGVIVVMFPAGDRAQGTHSMRWKSSRNTRCSDSRDRAA